MKNLLRKFGIASLLLTLLVATNSCVDYYYSDSTFYDNNLLGKWTLTGVNNTPVSGTAANAFNFMPNGRGIYYYYSQGRPQQMNISWYCDVGANPGTTIIYIQYQATGNNVSCRYYFRGNNLYMMFYNNSGLPTTYQYTYN